MAEATVLIENDEVRVPRSRRYSESATAEGWARCVRPRAVVRMDVSARGGGQA